MKKGFIFAVILVSIPVLGFSQAGNSWNVTNVATWIDAVNGVRSGGNDQTHTITVTGNVAVPPSGESTFGSVTGIIVAIQGNGTLSPSANGALLNIGTGQTVIAKNITLRGRPDDKNPNSVIDIMGGNFHMEGSASVTGNSGAGGVYVNGGTFTMKDRASVKDNKRSNGDYGAGVNMVNGGTFTMQGGTISGNAVTGYNGYGGGVYVGGGTFTMQGGTISGNTATDTGGRGEGGGVFVSGGKFIMQDSAILSENTASDFGGGVHIYGGSFTLRDNAVVSGNRSVHFGGGVYVSDGAFIMQGGTVSNNVAGSGGGGVYVSSNKSSITGGTISNNQAEFGGGVYLSDYSVFTAQNGTISNNRATASGGGVYHGESTTFTMRGNTTVSDNTANWGGGVYVYGGTFSMQDTDSVSGNIANGYGGGIYVNNSRGYLAHSGTVTIQGGTLSGNRATYNGGGVYNAGTFKKTGGIIYGNDGDQTLKNTVNGVGSAVYEASNGSWRNATAGLTMNSDSYGFLLNDGDVVTFPSGFVGNWRRNNFNNMLTFTENTVKANSSNNLWILQRVSGNSYTMKRSDATTTFTLTIRLDGTLEITGDSGSGENNWNGSWRKQN